MLALYFVIATVPITGPMDTVKCSLLKMPCCVRWFPFLIRTCIPSDVRETLRKMKSSA